MQVTKVNENVRSHEQIKSNVLQLLLHVIHQLCHLQAVVEASLLCALHHGSGQINTCKVAGTHEQKYRSKDASGDSGKDTMCLERPQPGMLGVIVAAVALLPDRWSAKGRSNGAIRPVPQPRSKQCIHMGVPCSWLDDLLATRSNRSLVSCGQDGGQAGARLRAGAKQAQVSHVASHRLGS